MVEILIGLAAVAVVALLEGLYYTLRFVRDREREELQRRLQSVGGVDSAGLRLLRQGKLSQNARLEGWLRGLPVAERLALLIEQAQVNITVARLLVISVVLGLLGASIGVMLRVLWLSPLLGGLGVAAPTLMVMLIRERRSRKLSEQLPDALDMMARSLRAGHALAGAFKLVATEMPPPVALEFGHAFEEQNLGLSFERAVVQMTRRAPGNRDLKMFAVSVVIQKETGGNLVEIIENIAETVRARYRFFGKLRALTAEGRLSASVIGALPFFTGVIAAAANPEYMRLLVTESVGQMFLAYAVVSWILGFFWLRKMAQVDY